MDVAALSSEVVPYLTAAVGAYGAAVLTKAEDAAATETVRFGQRLLRKLRGGGDQSERLDEAVTELAEDPEDADLQAALRVRVRKALADDPELAAEIAELIGGNTVTATGERSVAVGGNVSGVVSTGDGAKIQQ